MTWRTVKLGKVAHIEMGQSPPGASYNENGQGLPFFQGKADFGEEFPYIRKWCTAPKKIAEVSDILLSVRAPVGPTNVARERSCIGRGLAAVQGNPELVNQRYLLFCLKHQEQALAVQGQGSTFPAIGREAVEALEVPLPFLGDEPDLDEQRRIVEILDQIDRVRQLLQVAGHDDAAAQGTSSVASQGLGAPVPIGVRGRTFGGKANQPSVPCQLLDDLLRPSVPRSGGLSKQSSPLTSTQVPDKSRGQQRSANAVEPEAAGVFPRVARDVEDVWRDRVLG